ncbi:hypothetical protein GGG16DRAFT_129843 [Schizophyllum commune]
MANHASPATSELLDRALEDKQAAEAQRNALLRTVAHVNTSYEDATAQIVKLEAKLHDLKDAHSRERADHQATMRQYIIVRDKLKNVINGRLPSVSSSKYHCARCNPRTVVHWLSPRVTSEVSIAVMSAEQQSPHSTISEPHTVKRKWTTGIMKSWHGTDPTSTPPKVEYSDPKAAARAAKHKRRKVEAANLKTKDARKQAMLKPTANDTTPSSPAASASTATLGWRRFGPQGEDITQYTPHYPDVPTVMWPTGVTTIAPFLPDEGEANEARNKLSWYWGQDPVHGVVGANLYSLREFQDSAIRESNDLHPYVAATLLEFESWLKMPGKIRCILDLTCGFPQPDKITERIADNLVQSLASDFGHKYGGHFTIVADMMKTQDWFLLHTSGFLTFGHIDASGMATSAQIRGAGMKEWIIFTSTNMPHADAMTTRQRRINLQEQLIRRVADLVTAASTSSLAHKPTSSAAEKDIPATRDWEVDGCVLELRPGMKYYQPAATVHAAYTPVPTAAAGKHFFTYEDLHHVEIGRRVQRLKPGVTNHNHNCGVQLMLISLAAALPARAASGRRDYMTKPEELHKITRERTKPMKRPKESVERTKQRWEDTQRKRIENAEREAEYNMTSRLLDDDWADKGTAFDRLAYTVASRILYACKTAYAGDDKPSLPGPEYILDGDSWKDPGPVINVREFTDDLVTTHVDEIRGIEHREASRRRKERRRELRSRGTEQRTGDSSGGTDLEDIYQHC